MVFHFLDKDTMKKKMYCHNLTKSRICKVIWFPQKKSMCQNWKEYKDCTEFGRSNTQGNIKRN